MTPEEALLDATARLTRLGVERGGGAGSKRLASAKGRETKPAFVAVTMPVTPSTRAEIEIRVAGVAVIVREGCDVEHVVRVVEALGRRTRPC